MEKSNNVPLLQVKELHIIDLQTQVLQLQAQLLQVQAQSLSQKRAVICDKCGVGPTDQVNLETGEIIRPTIAIAEPIVTPK